MRLGKCKHNPEGKVVLLLGAMVLREIPGPWLCDCVDKYHRQNLSQMGAAQMLLELSAQITKLLPQDSKVVRFTEQCLEANQPSVSTLRRQFILHTGAVMRFNPMGNPAPVNQVANTTNINSAQLAKEQHMA